jgi:acyl carrier protein
VSSVLRAESGQLVNPRSRLMDLGLDSLMAVELRNRLATGLGLGRSLPATLMFDYPTIDAIAAYLERDVLGLGSLETPASHAGPSAQDEAAARLDEMSEEEAEALLLQKLGNL